MAVALALFGWLALVPVLGSGHGWDGPVQAAVHDRSSETLDRLFVAVARVGGGPVLGVVVGLAAVVLAARGRRRPGAVLILGLAWSELLTISLKLAFRRARPALWASPAPALGWSFPSGHAMTSSALAVLVVGLLWRTRWRLPALVVAVPCVLLVGLCRVYLGVHYPSDVLAGWCVTATWTAALVALRGRRAGSGRGPDAPVEDGAARALSGGGAARGAGRRWRAAPGGR